MTALNDTAPKRIYLCVSDEADDNDMPYPELYAEDAEITWSTDQPVAVTVEYVRADIAAADLAAARALLRSVTCSRYDEAGNECNPTTLCQTCRNIDAALAQEGGR